MTTIDHEILVSFFQRADERLSGDWVLLGGSVLKTIGCTERVTIDIDLAGPTQVSQSDSLALLTIAQSLGLEVEAINQAGAFFLRQIADWQDRLVLIFEGSNLRFFRPNASLFIQLKMARLSEIDLEDCKVMIDYGLRNQEHQGFEDLVPLIENKWSDAHGPLKKRLAELKKKITKKF